MTATTNGETQHTGAKVTLDDFVHVGPGTLAGRFLRRFWHPVYLARELPAGWAKPVRILGEDFTLYRGESGTPHAVAFRCAHRGTQLSTGWVEGDCVRCFYHGWKYDASGQCVEMPAEDPSFPPKVKIRSYPTEEYVGLIFVYLGEGEPPPLPRYPELEGEGLLTNSSYLRECNYYNQLESNMDELHVAFVHRESVFSDVGLNVDIPEVSGEETDYGVVKYGKRSNGIVRVSHFFMPNILYISSSPEDEASGWSEHIAWRVPVDDYSHRSFQANLVHVTGEAARRYQETQRQRREQLAGLPSANEVAAAVLRGELHTDDLRDRPDVVGIQDNVAQCGQGVIADRVHERLGRSDVLLIMFRKIWERELQALADGRPLKEWRRTERLAVTSGV
ncbi:MAG TPA: Rieske 2Fe-2S domain-containing protein [Chloroflexota bacterium]|nr:Rieske 2Fe-2S domain-containing protein [Chloroflexota bacterium]